MTAKREQEKLNEIWREYKEAKSEEARNLLVEEYIPLVKYVAGRLAINLPNSVDVGDLEGFGFSACSMLLRNSIIPGTSSLKHTLPPGFAGQS